MGRVRMWTWLLVLVGLVVIAGACAAEEEAPTESPPPTEAEGALVEEAQQIVDELSGPAVFAFEGPPIEVGDALRGKRIYAIGNGLEFFFVRNWLRGVTEAAEVLGMTVTAVDAFVSDPAGLIDQAVGQKYDVILMQSVESARLAAPLAAAKEAGIPVIELTTSDPHLPTPEEAERGVFGFTTFCYSCAGRQMAAFIVADGGPHTQAVIYNVPGLVVSEAMVEAFSDELMRLCPSCGVEVVSAPFAQWEELQAMTGTAIETNRDAERLYLVPVFDSMVPIGVAAAIAEKEVQDWAKIVTYNGTDAGLPGVADGSVAADIGGPQVWLGWATVDQVARALLGQPPVEDYSLPHRIFWEENIGEIDLDAPEDTWYATDFRSEFRRLWGVGS
jgi:ABC-type sugar transport system substrate-binding protein